MVRRKSSHTLVSYRTVKEVEKIMKPQINLRKLRKERGWTQEQVASELGFCRSYISVIENGKQGLSGEMINAIIKVFDVKYEDFYNEEKK